MRTGLAKMVDMTSDRQAARATRAPGISPALARVLQFDRDNSELGRRVAVALMIQNDDSDDED